MLDRLDALRNEELEDLIRLSYAMVAAKAPKGAGKKAKQAAKKRTAPGGANHPKPPKNKS